MARSGAIIAIVIAIVAAIALTQNGDDQPGDDRTSGAARICADAGYLRLARADGTRFTTETDCLIYAEEGRTVITIPPTAPVTHTPSPPTPTPTPRQLSAACQALNSETYDGRLSVGYVARAPFHVGERIAITATLPVAIATPAAIRFKFADTEQSISFPGTSLLVVPEDITTDVSWSVSDGVVKWFVTCTI
jgi:hypothetical protein